jgi:hypothetical protein
MITQRTDLAYTTPNLPNIFPYPMRLGANLGGWWSADVGTLLSGSNVLSWTDRSSYAARVTNTGSPNPIVVVPNAQNGLPGLQTSQTAGNNVAASNAFLYSASSLPGLDLMEWNVPWNITILFKVGAFAGTETSHFLFSYGTGINNAGAIFLNTRNTGANFWTFSVY